MKTENHILQFLITLFLLTGCSVANEETPERAFINDTIPIDTIKAQPQRIGIKMQKKGGVYEIPCLVNGLKMNFIFDTGASNVCISLTEALFMYKNGYITDEDLGDKTYGKVADGSIIENTKLKLKTIEIAGISIHDIDAVVVSSIEAPLLLGQSAIQKIGKFEMDADSLFVTRSIQNHSEINNSSTSKIDMLPAPEISWWNYITAFFGDDTKIEELINAAHNAYINDMPELTDKYCEQARKLCERNWQINCFLGYINILNAKKSVSGEIRDGYYRRVIGYLNEAINFNKKAETLYLINGDSVSFYQCKNYLALAYAVAAPYDLESVSYIQNLILEDPCNISAIKSLSLCYTKSGKYDLAEKWAQKLLELDNEIGYFMLAYLAQAKDDLDLSIRYYEKVLDINPNSAGAMNNLANSLYERNHRESRYDDRYGHFCEEVDRNKAIELKKQAAKLGSSFAQKWLEDKNINWK